ncbi:hypothetical protein T484DRAFT_1970535, partial [Baffinella frigidus]
MSRVHAPLLPREPSLSTTQSRQISRSQLLCTLGSRLASPPCSMFASCCVHALLHRVRACSAAPRAPSLASSHHSLAHVSSNTSQCRTGPPFSLSASVPPARTTRPLQGSSSRLPTAPCHHAPRAPDPTPARLNQKLRVAALEFLPGLSALGGGI